jgi:hypothetical protein
VGGLTSAAADQGRVGLDKAQHAARTESKGEIEEEMWG